MMISAIKPYNVNFGTKSLSTAFAKGPQSGTDKDFRRIDMELNSTDNGDIIIAYETDDFKEIGSERIYPVPNTNILEGKYITTSIRRKGVGGILHLSTIAMLINSDYEKIKIDSVKSAVLFHREYGFFPNLSKSQEAGEFLDAILLDENIIPEELTQKAKFLDKKTNKQTHKSFKKEDFDTINSLLDEYFEFFKQTYGSLSPSSLNEALPMILTKDTVLGNKDYFNYLFEDKNMNYQIK